jgi:hypothetical protein
MKPVGAKKTETEKSKDEKGGKRKGNKKTKQQRGAKDKKRLYHRPTLNLAGSSMTDCYKC